MNKIYDKLLLVVAVLLLAGGVFLYLQKSAQAPSMGAPVDVTPADNPYAPETVPTSESTEASWPEAVGNPSRPEWVYDVFTPPKIYIDEEGNFTQEGWKPEPPKAPFGVYLAEITRKPYRIQFEGYIEEDRDDASKTLLLLFNEETQQQVRARPGDKKPGAEFEVLDFDIRRIRDDDNNIDVVARATLLDQRSGEEVVLVHGERRYDSGVTVLIRSREHPDFEKVLTQAPVEFEGPEAKYTLLEINLEESSVTVEKQGTGEEESETRTLRVGSGNASPAPKPSPSLESNQEEQDNAFELMFQ